MRAGAWWSAAALALLAVTSALRTTQVEGASRTGRRLPAPTATEAKSSTEIYQSDPVVSTFRPRSSRRRQDVVSQDVHLRSQSRRPLQRTVSLPTTEELTKDERNERFDSRRNTNRMRHRVNENSATTEASSTKNDYVVRSRSRQGIRRVSISSTQIPLEVSSPYVDESKTEIANLEEITKIGPKDDTANQFKRRSSTITTIETVTPKRLRGRINTRPNARSLDLDISGTTNAIINVEKEPTTARSSADLRNSRKLRYRTRLSETDTNLTGEGITAKNEVINSSQKVENITSHQENQEPIPASQSLPESSSSSNSPQQIDTLSVKSTTTKATKIVRRPLSRGKVNFKPAISIPKTKVSDEISEDDNYPESFKALIQAKNASTQASSPNSESLTLKASQKVYKTFVTSPQSNNTGSTTNKYSRHRNKLIKQTESQTEEEKIATTVTDAQKPRKVEFRPRGSYSPRSRKLTSFTSSESSTSTSSQSTTKPAYKYNRKFKVTSTQAPISDVVKSQKDDQTGAKRSFIRPSLYTRKSFNRKNVSLITDNGVVAEKNNNNDIKPPSKITLPRTSYYSRTRSNKNNTSTTTDSPREENKEIVSIENKSEDTADMPLIFTLLNNPTEKDSSAQNLDVKQNENQMFIIKVTSKESQEQTPGNEILTTAEESEKSPVDIETPTTIKYHAIYKDPESNNHLESTEYFVSSTPPVKNIKSGANLRKRVKSYEKDKDINITIKPKSRERSLRKHNESFPKSTEASTNGITSDSDKPRSRFSSKFRASYLDKPFYKPTVPTITTSTAWLKFFVTDHVLTKYLEEPYWFDGEDFPDVSTESMTRQTITTPSITHESSIELVEGEEIDLGPDINAISFTKTRSKLASADLRLSESLVKSSHIMNVEASHHSPSVTVSIFDALAEILTSTPRTRLSTTTEVLPKQNTINDVKQTFNGVSNNINVNSVPGFASQDTTIQKNAGANTNAKSVQNTGQTQNVINRIAVGESTQSLKPEDGITPVNKALPTLSSTLLPTTPISARRPFAIRVLYSESPSDQSTTAPTTLFQASTDNPTTVYNTVSDLLLTSNNIVSSELTSMLSNNIKNIIQNMDENSRTRLSVDMTKLLKTLIPRALDRLTTVVNNVDIIPNTTPYSLEDIKDTENIDIIDIIDAYSSPNSANVLQNELSGNDVNNSQSILLTSTPTNITTQAVNSPESTQKPSTSLVSNHQVTLVDIDSFNTLNTIATLLPSAQPNTITSDLKTTSSDLLDTADTVNIENSDTTNLPNPVPFLTNFRVLEDTSLKPSETVSLLSQDGQVQEQNVSSLQLWVLSKKARVLKMIEDIIRQHNNEIATVTPSSETIQTNNIPLSDRLTKIMESLTLTTKATDNVTNDITTPLNIPSSTTISMISTLPPILSNQQIQEAEVTTTTTSNDLRSKDTETSILLRLGMTETTGPQVSSSTETTAVNYPTQQTTVTSLSSTMAESSTTTVQENTETTTDSMAMETTTQSNIDSTLMADAETTIKTDLETTTTLTTEINSKLILGNETSNVSSTIPKKDYVIFGILPNNTVVRKDPNEDILESLTEASPYIIYGVLPNNTVIRKFPNGTRVPRVMQKIDVLPISPWSLRNPYSPIHNNPAIVRPKSNPIRVSTNTVTSTDITNNGTENRVTTDTISPSALNIKDSGSLGITTTTSKPPAEKSTASHVLSLRTTTMLPSVDEILLNSISSAAKEEMVIASMTTSTREPRILTLDIDPETKQIRTEKPDDGSGSTVFKFIPIDEVTVSPQNSNVLKLATKMAATKVEMQTTSTSTITEINTQTPQIQTSINVNDPTTTTQSTARTSIATEATEIPSTNLMFTTIAPVITTTESTTPVPITTTTPVTTTMSKPVPTTTLVPTTPATVGSTLSPAILGSATVTTEEEKIYQQDAQLLRKLLEGTRDSKQLNIQRNNNLITELTTTTVPSTPFTASKVKQNDQVKLLEALLAVTGQKTNSFLSSSSTMGTSTPTIIPTTTTRSIESDLKQLEEDTKLLKALLQATGQNPANFNLPTLNLNVASRPTTTTTSTTTETRPTTTLNPSTDFKQLEEDTKLLKALLQATGQNPANFNLPTLNFNVASRPTTTTTSTTTETRPTTTSKPSTDLKQLEEDTKLLKALLQATGQNPANFNLSTLNFNTASRPTSTTSATTTTSRPSTTINPSTTFKAITSTDADIKKLQEDTKILQALLQATGQNPNNLRPPIISGVTSNVRIASNPLTTSLGSNPTTPINVRPVYTSTTPSVLSNIFSFSPRTVTNTLQPGTATSTEEVKISTTLKPRRTTTPRIATTTVSARRATVPRSSTTTEIPSTSTFSVEEDLAFLKNLKSVLKANPSNDDPEAALANRIIALAVERSLNEIQSGTRPDSRTGKNIANNVNNAIPTTTPRTITTTSPKTTTTTTTTPRPSTTTIVTSTPSLDEDIKQFQEDTKLLQALIKATGQDPSKFNIPTLPNLPSTTNVSPRIKSEVNDELKSSNLLTSLSPLTVPLDSITPKNNTNGQTKTKVDLTKPFGAKIAVKDKLKTVQDDEKLLKTLVKLQDAQETTTQKNKLAITGQTSDEALKKLLQKTKPSKMVSEATQAPMSLSTEFGKSNDALLAALLKEQGFGPTTASSLDEQLRLSALLNQVVVTPKARRTTTPPPPPPPPRRPILDGLAWLWQQWRETGPGPSSARPNRRPSPSASPSASTSAATSNRVNWFGSGPFVGNADDRPTSNRIPLEPPGAVTSQQTPGRGQLVSAAINVTRAFSQFLGAAIQGAAQTVQNVIRAGQRAATDVYVNGSGVSG